MPWITPHAEPLHDPFDIFQVYNALDCLATEELYHCISSLPDTGAPEYARTLDRVMRVSAVCLALSAHGKPVDRAHLSATLAEIEQDISKLEQLWRTFLDAIGHPPFNHRSIPALKLFFYDFLGIPAAHRFDKKRSESVVTLDRNALESRVALYPHAQPFVQVLLALRDLDKMRGVLRTGIESDDRLVCSYNPCGTETGRLSSNRNVFGRGTNAQNITPRLRRFVSAPTGYFLFYVDLEQAESRAVAYLAGDEAYINACESGDLHTTATKMIWSSLPWGTAPDRKVAEAPFFRHFTYRDMAKRGGHATNYLAKPATISRALHISRDLAEDFQRRYFQAFPGIRLWQLATIAELQANRRLVTPLGRARVFWGRPDDEATHREAVAFVPQSLVGDIMNEGLYQAMRAVAAERIDARAIAQTHDSCVFLCREEDREWIVPWLCEHLLFPVEVRGRVLRIPLEAKVGWNWAPFGPDNPDGLRKWPEQPRERRSAHDVLMDIKL